MILNINRSLSRFFPYHLVPTSPWPLLVSFSLLSIILSAVMYMHGYPNGGIFLSLGFTITALSLVFWFRYMVKEATNEGAHPTQVQNGLVIGFVLFIALVIALLVLSNGDLLTYISQIGLKIKSFSLSSKIKLAFIAFFIFVTLILFYLDFKSIEETNLNVELKQSGIGIPKSFKDAFFGLGPAVIAYYTVVDNTVNAIRFSETRLQQSEEENRKLLQVGTVPAKLALLKAENSRLSDKDLRNKYTNCKCC